MSGSEVRKELAFAQQAEQARENNFLDPSMAPSITTKVELASKNFFTECFQLLTVDEEILKIKNGKTQLNQEAYIQALQAKFTKAVEENITGIDRDIYSIIDKYKTPLEKMLQTAVTKLAQEMDKPYKHSLEIKTEGKNRSGFDFPGKICDSLSHICHKASLILKTEFIAAELFKKSAKYGEKLKLNLEKQRVRNSKSSLKNSFPKTSQVEQLEQSREVNQSNSSVMRS